MIDNILIKSFINCNYKAYLMLIKTHVANTYKYASIEFDTIEYIRAKHKEINSESCNNSNFINNSFAHDDFLIEFYKITNLNNKLTAFEISIFNQPSKEEKLFSCFKAFIFNTYNKKKIEKITFICGINLKISNVNISIFSIEYSKILSNIQNLNNDKIKISPSIKPHCQICQFQSICKKKLIEKEDLSLLSGLKNKEIIKKQAKGIFSITQLAYTFSPNRKLYSKRKFLPELKALAIKDNKTYIIESPKFKTSEIEIFLDIEGTPDTKDYYLLSIIVKKGDKIDSFSWWKNTNENIFEPFLNMLTKYDDYIIYHFGSYDVTALKSQKEFFKESNLLESLDIALTNTVNVLNEFMERIYPPTFTNSLKDICSFLKYERKTNELNGYKSIFLRKYWEFKDDSEIKNKLIQYNLEDCESLLVVKQWLDSLSNNIELDENFKQVSKIKKSNPYKFGDSGYIVPEFKDINSLAYFNYQREKIYIKTEKKLVKKIITTPKIKKIIPNTIVKVTRPSKCPICGNEVIYKHIKSTYRYTYDLKFGKSSIKKWIIAYEQARFRCYKCKHAFVEKIVKSIPKFGWNVQIWCVNQMIAYNMSIANTLNILKEQFDIRVSNCSALKFKSFFAEYYKNTVENIRNKMINGNLLQVDESQVEIKKIKGKCYVWVFTTIDSVFYLFKENRETVFLDNLLNGFKGIIISDFYTGYDSLNCPQQKCLIHLMRDLNDDLIKNPFNTDNSEDFQE